MRASTATLITAPATEPFTVAEVKAYPRIDPLITDDDTQIGVMLQAAREYVEKHTRRALITQTWDVSFPAFPSGSTTRRIVYGAAFDEQRAPRSSRMEMPLPPLQSVTHVKYYDTSGVQQTWAAASYVVHVEGGHGFVELATGYDWPDVQSDRSNPITARIVCGYGAASAVPARIKQAIWILVGDAYSFRESEITGTITSKVESQAVDRLLSPYLVRG